MLPNIKPTLLLLLALTSTTTIHATPVPNPYDTITSLLHPRAKVADITCGPQKFTADQITASLKVVNSGAQIGAYPKKYGNSESVPGTLGQSKQLFASTSQLWEFPLLNPVYYGGAPGLYRVVVNDNYKYMGAMYHTAGLANAFQLCTVT